MRNCVVCNKELCRTTKGDLCIQCYRNRNNVNDQNRNTSCLEFPAQQIDSTDRIDASITPINNGNDTANSEGNHDDTYDDIKMINIIKNSMLKEQSCNDEIIAMQSDHIIFLKQEIIHKNKLINDLMAALKDENKHQTKENNINSNPNSTITDNHHNGKIT